MTKLEEQLRFEEGCKLEVYRCTEGFRTIGVGRNLDANPFFEGNRIPDRITQDQADAILAHDIREVIKDLNRAWPGLSLLQCARHDACINMAFQLGINGFLQFRMMRQALSRCDWLAARNEALDSLWARQTPNRARRVAEQILTGEYYEIL